MTKAEKLQKKILEILTTEQLNMNEIENREELFDHSEDSIDMMLMKMNNEGLLSRNISGEYFTPKP